eukprot:scaffold112749_cov24-Phaeocystis_antarctica.AAC.1
MLRTRARAACCALGFGLACCCAPASGRRRGSEPCRSRTGPGRRGAPCGSGRRSAAHRAALGRSRPAE